ncbi:GTPase HflX [Egicoccus halophilus]|uniref:GTPase HflX n=1 Tax=Egicoccus halophilus TaxID=1670830 RepID=A0A8J3A8K8_9ACTN|nr:GTPase HflX [Egicoccus halophilus]GGI06622.1 GTPase HflX [Egicoccus halophilus]
MDGYALDDEPAADDLLLGDGSGLSAEQLSRAEERRRRRDVIEEGAPREGVDIIRRVEAAVIVGVQLPGRTSADVEASLDELEALLDTAGAEVVERVVQRLDTPQAATYIGGGKVGELRELVAAHGADAVVFDDELSPAQQRTLEERVKQKVLDRTIVILDIFAQHATSREGKAQVELAQLNYLLPRLRGWGTALSRQAGGRTAGGAGIGGRGPGETQLEVDRRRIMRRIAKLRRDLKDYARIRETKASERERNRVQVAALVGYTNAGKSSLLNRLTGADVLVENRLFATLDPTVRRLPLDDGRDIVLTDTVGFVRKLPHGLVEAFKSTLEESLTADLLVHVVDASHPEAESHIVAVHEVLEEIGADAGAEQLVLNKIDRADPATVEALARRVQVELDADPVLVSAHTGEGIEDLVERIGLRIPGQRIRISAHVPYARQDLVALAHRSGQVVKEAHGDKGTELVADLDVRAARRLRPYLDVDVFAEEPEDWERETGT